MWHDDKFGQNRGVANPLTIMDIPNIHVEYFQEVEINCIFINLFKKDRQGISDCGLNLVSKRSFLLSIIQNLPLGIEELSS